MYFLVNFPTYFRSFFFWKNLNLIEREHTERPNDQQKPLRDYHLLELLVRAHAFALMLFHYFDFRYFANGRTKFTTQESRRKPNFTHFLSSPLTIHG